MSEKAKKSVKKTSKVSAKAAPKAKGEKVAVVMFNLGGPDSPQAVRPFLMNFFMDRNIISLPVPFRCLIAWLIAKKRSRAEAKDSYDELGGSSPLLKNTQAQAVALEKELKASKDGNKYKTFVCMRYWHPMSAQIVREVRDWGADRIVFMPLYPQFSTTTTWSARERWDKDAYEAGYTDIPSSMVCCYPTEKGFIEACAENIYAQYQAAVKDKQENIRILLSAHGLPEDIVENGDPYQWQCEQTAEAIIAQMEKKYKLKSLDYVVCYQSRVGPKKWIGPSLDEALQQAAHDNKAVVILPHAFTQEHVETLVELDVEYKHIADELGIKGYYRAQTVGVHPAYIGGLAKMVVKQAASEKITSDTGKCVCPEKFDRCCMRAYSA